MTGGSYWGVWSHQLVYHLCVEVACRPRTSYVPGLQKPGGLRTIRRTLGVLEWPTPQVRASHWGCRARRLCPVAWISLWRGQYTYLVEKINQYFLENGGIGIKVHTLDSCSLSVVVMQDNNCIKPCRLWAYTWSCLHNVVFWSIISEWNSCEFEGMEGIDAAEWEVRARVLLLLQGKRSTKLHRIDMLI